MNVLDTKTDKEIIQSVLAEIAKCTNEIKSAESDIQKVRNRLSFLIVMTNELINRNEVKR